MATTTLRPSADSYKNNVLFSTGAVMFSLLDDSPDDDATYIRVPPLIYSTQAYAVLNWPDTVTLAANQRIRAVRLRCRARLHLFSNGYAASVAMALRDGRNGKRDFAEKFTTGSTVAGPFTGTWRTAPPKSWGQSTWTAYILSLTQSDIIWYRAATGGSAATGEQLRVSELYMDVDIRDQAVVSAVTVAGNTTTTRPTVTWTYTPNADLDLQVAYRLKIFSSAQYGITGFNPETSPSTWDSGEVSGNSTTATVGKDLLNGATYKAYVKAAASFNGTRWFSAWDLSSSFAMGLQSLTLPTLLVTPDTTVPWLRNVITINHNLNLLTLDESSAEATVGTWQNIGNTTVARSLAQQASGLASISLTATAAADMNVKTADAGYRVEAGVSYTFLAQFRANTTARSCQIGYAFYDRTGTIIGASTFSGSVTDSNANFNAQATVTVVAPANAVTVSLRAKVIAPAAGEVHYMDKISVSTSASTTWASGGYLGTAYALVEVCRASQAPRNLVTAQVAQGGDVLRTADGFFPSGTFSRAMYDMQQRNRGEGSIRWELLDASNTKLYIGYPATAFPNSEQVYALPVVPGRTYTVGVWAKASASTTSQLNLQCLDKDGGSIGGATSGGSISITTSWQLFTATVTPAAGAVWVRPHLDNSSSVVDRNVWVNQVVMQVGSSVDTSPAPPSQAVIDWEPVRGADTGQLIPSSDPGDGISVLMDNEVPPGHTLFYRARLIVPETTAYPALSSDVTPYVATMMDPPGQGIWVLRDPEVANATVRCRAVSLSESRHEESGVAYPARRYRWGDDSQRAVVVSDFIGGTDGELEMWVDAEEEWTLLDTLLATQRVLWLIFPDFGAKYVRLTQDRSWSRESERSTGGAGITINWRRKIKVSYVETARPV